MKKKTHDHLSHFMPALLVSGLLGLSFPALASFPLPMETTAASATEMPEKAQTAAQTGKPGGTEPSADPQGKNTKLKIDRNTPSTTMEFPFSNFNAITCNSTFDFVLIPSDEEKAEIHLPAPLVPYLNVEQKGNRLNFNIKNVSIQFTAGQQESFPVVYLYFKEIREIKLSGQSRVVFQGVHDAGQGDFNYVSSGINSIEGHIRNLNNLNIDAKGIDHVALDLQEVRTAKLHLQGSSDFNGNLENVQHLILSNSGVSEIVLDLDKVQTLNFYWSGIGKLKGCWDNIGQLSFSAPGSLSSASLSGKALSGFIEVDGVADLNFKNLVFETLECKVTGFGTLKLNASRSFKGKANPGSKIHVYGSPEECKVETLGYEKQPFVFH